MEIRFSDGFRADPQDTVDNIASTHRAHMHLSSASGQSVRFTLRRSYRAESKIVDDMAHDIVIRALLTLDPDARVRTAKAVFNGLKDFEAQRGKK